MVSKPTKPTNVMRDFTGGIKRDFDPDLKVNGFQENVKQILQGDNLNYLLDSLGRELTYIRTVVDYIRDINPYKIPYVDSNNNLVEADINTLLPTQTGNSGKFLTTNGTTTSWSESLTDIGDPIFTLNFNKVLTSDYIWLDGRELAVSNYPELFAIYGYTYSDTTGGAYFKVPNFTNCTIWGGTTAGKVEAGLPNITGTFNGSQLTDGGNTGTGAFKGGGAKSKLTVGSGGDSSQKGFSFDASKNYNTDGTYTETLYGKSNTVQPPAIKVRAYTRAR